MDKENLIEIVSQHYDDKQVDVLKDAIVLAEEKHRGQKRLSGEDT